MAAIRVLLVDDHPLFREGLMNILNSKPDFEVVGEAGDGLEAQIKARQLKPDLILMDVSMPGYDGLEATKRIRRELPDVTIVMLTVRDDEEKLFEAIKNGAQGYLLKSIRSEEMLRLLRGAVRGEAAISPYMGGRMLEEFRRISNTRIDDSARDAVILTPREVEVLSLVAEGETDKEIAQILNLSIHTVKSHMRKILAKLHLDGRREAAAYALREGLLPPSTDSMKRSN